MLGQFIVDLMLGQIWKTSLDLFHLRALHAFRLKRKVDKNKYCFVDESSRFDLGSLFLSDYERKS